MGMLDDFNAAYGEADTNTGSGGGGDVPDGSYQVRVERAYLNRTKSGNEPRMNWQLRIIGPTQANRVVFHARLIRNDPDMLSYLKGDLAIMGVEVGSLSELEQDATLTKMLDLCLNVTVKTKGDFQNVYINERIDPPASTIPGADENPPIEAYNDDIPAF